MNGVGPEFAVPRSAQGKRYSLANSRIMIHQPLGGAQGQAADIEIQANEILHHKLTLNGYLAEFTGQSMEKITADTDRDFFMSAQVCRYRFMTPDLLTGCAAICSRLASFWISSVLCPSGVLFVGGTC